MVYLQHCLVCCYMAGAIQLQVNADADLFDLLEDVPLVAFMYPVFTCMPNEIYHWRFRSVLCA